MLDLRLVGVADDGSALLLGDDDGRSYRLPIDEAVGAAVRGDRSRIARQLQVEPGELRPRDIQAWVRAGASPEMLASQSGMPLDRVRRYAGPVLAERAHVVQLAQSATARLSVRSEGPAPRLEEAVHQRLGEVGVEARLARWDAWRREDGAWTVEVAHPPVPGMEPAEDDGPARARFVLDMGTRTAVADDEPARWLLGEEPEIRAPFIPRLAPAVPEPDVEIDTETDADIDSGPDVLAPAIPAPAHAHEEGAPEAAAPPVAAVGENSADENSADENSASESASRSASESAAGSGPRRDRRSERRSRRAPRTTSASDATTSAPPPAERKAAGETVRPGRRPPVPSWDEILFGSGRPQG